MCVTKLFNTVRIRTLRVYTVYFIRFLSNPPFATYMAKTNEKLKFPLSSQTWPIMCSCYVTSTCTTGLHIHIIIISYRCHSQVSSNFTVSCQKHDIETWLMVPFGEHNGASARQVLTCTLNDIAVCLCIQDQCFVHYDRQNGSV